MVAPSDVHASAAVCIRKVVRFFDLDGCEFVSVEVIDAVRDESCAACCGDMEGSKASAVAADAARAMAVQIVATTADVDAGRPTSLCRRTCGDRRVAALASLSVRPGRTRGGARTTRAAFTYDSRVIAIPHGAPSKSAHGSGDRARRRRTMRQPLVRIRAANRRSRSTKGLTATPVERQRTFKAMPPSVGLEQLAIVTARRPATGRTHARRADITAFGDAAPQHSSRKSHRRARRERP